jgi:hypothetical protein
MIDIGFLIDWYREKQCNATRCKAFCASEASPLVDINESTEFNFSLARITRATFSSEN